MKKKYEGKGKKKFSLIGMSWAISLALNYTKAPVDLGLDFNLVFSVLFVFDSCYLFSNYLYYYYFILNKYYII